MPTKRRAVITGAAGFLGSHLSETLLDLDFSVVGIDNFITGDRANIAHLAGRDFTFIKHNISNVLLCPAPWTSSCTGPARPARSTTWSFRSRR